ncbi:MAG: DUF4388 domain-containing protein [Planctomycetota bacterium]
MEFKGELRRNGLPTLFRNFSSENFHGVLTISCPVGDKLITLTENEVTIYCDELNEASRLGNILIGRGLITEEALEDTLRDQKRLEPRPKLGDMLIQRGIVSEKGISDARRFQIEEDICDILSWKNARYTFEGADSGREIHPEDFAYDQVHRMPIDPDSFFKYVAKVTDDWDAIGDRLPTQYLCFKLTPKATDTIATLPKDTQRILRFLKEGRSVEGTVKQSCIGRIQVCVCVIELLEKGLVLPASGPDLRFMASEHRAQKRYHDALYIYRRILESPDANEERNYLENLIAEITATIIRLKQEGQYGEEAVIVSHKGAKEKYEKSVRNRKIFWGIFTTAALLVCGVVIIQSKRPPEIPALYVTTVSEVDSLCSKGKFNEANRLLSSFLDTIQDKDSHVASIIRDRIGRIPDLIYIYIKNLLPGLYADAERGGEASDQAVEKALYLLEEYPGNPCTQDLKDFLTAYPPRKPNGPSNPVDPTNKKPTETAILDALRERLHKAEGLMQSKKYSEALIEYNAIRKEAAAESEPRKSAESGAQAIEKIRSDLDDSVKQAENTWVDKKGDAAIALIELTLPKFGDLPGLAYAEALKTRYTSLKSTAQILFTQALELEARHNYFDARAKFRQIAKSFPEFPIAVEAAEHAKSLDVKCNELEAQIKAAVSAAAEGDFKKSRDIFKSLLALNEALLIELKIEIPVFVSTFPSGSLLKLNGKPKGLSPQNLMIPVGELYEITAERPGFNSKKMSKGKITTNDFDVSIRLDLDPIVIDFPPPQFQTPPPLLAPAMQFDNKIIILNGPDMLALDPPSRDPVWTVPGLYDRRAALPENVPADDKNYWNLRVPPISHKPGFLLQPLRSHDLLEIDVRNPDKPVKRSLFSKTQSQTAEIVGTMCIDEKSIHALKPALIAAYSDGLIRCFLDFDSVKSASEIRWTLPIDASDAARKDPLAAGLFSYERTVWSLSSGGLLQSIDIISGQQVFKKQFQAMSPRSTFWSNSKVSLLAMVQRTGQVTLFDIGIRREIWSLPPRPAMEESVGVLFDDSGIFVATRTKDYGELKKYPMTADATGAAVKAIVGVSLDGYVNLDMASSKNIYVITHVNKIFAYTKTDLSKLWEYTLKPELGNPTSIRAFGDNVYVLTDRGKVVILKSE